MGREIMTHIKYYQVHNARKTLQKASTFHCILEVQQLPALIAMVTNVRLDIF
jgi:hypothetical protein